MSASGLALAPKPNTSWPAGILALQKAYVRSVLICRSNVSRTRRFILSLPTVCAARTGAPQVLQRLPPRAHRRGLQPLLEGGQLLLEPLREPRAELLEVLVDPGQLGDPAFHVHAQQLGDGFVGHAQPGQVECPRRGQPAE